MIQSSICFARFAHHKYKFVLSAMEFSISEAILHEL